MNINDFRLWDPFTVQGGRVLLAAPDVWRHPEIWSESYQLSCEAAAYGASEPSDVNVLLPDLFAEYMGTVTDHENHMCWTNNPASKSDFLTYPDVLRDIFATIDKSPLLTFWCPTRHPERVRERWPGTEPFGDVAGMVPGDASGVMHYPKRRQNVRIGLTADLYYTTIERDMLDELQDLCGVFVLRENGDVEVLG